jgi:cation/acetate symporter
MVVNAAGFRHFWGLDPQGALWWGVHPMSAGIFGVPAGFAAIALATFVASFWQRRQTVRSPDVPGL